MDLTEFYVSLKVFHVISIITWMAGLFYLPRLFVYHAQQYDNTGFRKVVEIQESKLYYYIMYPAMIAVLISGTLITLSIPDIMKIGGWMHAKLTFVFLLFVYHFVCGFYRKKLLDNKYKSELFFRFFNEIPTILMVLIVFLVIAKPF